MVDRILKVTLNVCGQTVFNREEDIMDNWYFAFINETRRRQEQIAEADRYRLAQQGLSHKPGLWRIFQNFLLKLAHLRKKADTRLGDQPPAAPARPGSLPPAGHAGTAAH
jgi:hypothetical protein